MRLAQYFWFLTAVFGALSVGGCGGSSGSPSQVVATVGGKELTESQVHQLLERQGALKPEEVDAASRKVVADLVDQEIILQKALDLKMDRDQRVVQNLELSKRDIVARAYLDRIAEGAAKPSAKEIQAYYDDNPALFAQRRIYTFQEYVVEAGDAQKKQIEAQLGALRSQADLEAFLKAGQFKATTKRSDITPENIPLPMLQRVSALNVGQGVLMTVKGGVRILLLLGTKDSPVREVEARPAINAFLLNRHRRAAVERELVALRAASKVAYFGKFADLAASAASAGSAASGGSADARRASVEVSSAADRR